MKARTFAEEVQWNAYLERKKAFDEAREKVRPRREHFVNDYEYEQAHSKWIWESMVDAPNKPGYEFANND